jgi:hypothetical protein
MRTTALDRLLAGAKQAISKRLQSRSVGVGAAPEFTPKRNCDTIRTAAGSPATPRCTSLANTGAGIEVARDTCLRSSARLRIEVVVQALDSFRAGSVECP